MRFIERAWYNNAPWLWLLWPLSITYRLLFLLRNLFTGTGESKPGVPVIVVGNITVGGTGKTPLIISLCAHLQELGMNPGIISRGYAGNANSYPMVVDADSDPASAGDEPVLIASKSGCPVVVDPDRPRALACLQDKFDVNVVLSDDGLQHNRLHRDIEIAVVDGQRLFGNGLCLPAGPLREPIARLDRCHFTVLNGEAASSHPALQSAVSMKIIPTTLVNLLSGERRPFAGAPFNIGNKVQAVAAIGNPQRFFDSLDNLPYSVETLAFPDHHLYQPGDFEALDSHQPIVMTEKDGIKCHSFASANMWCVEIEAELPEALLSGIEKLLQP